MESSAGPLYCTAATSACYLAACYKVDMCVHSLLNHSLILRIPAQSFKTGRLDSAKSRECYKSDILMHITCLVSFVSLTSVNQDIPYISLAEACMFATITMISRSLSLKDSGILVLGHPLVCSLFSASLYCLLYSIFPLLVSSGVPACQSSLTAVKQCCLKS